MSKQELIENELDRIGATSTGNELVALIALHSRQVAGKWKPNQFIKEFAHSIGFWFNRELLYIDIAVRVLKYLYPVNRAFWDIWDEKYYSEVKNSAWLKQASL